MVFLLILGSKSAVNHASEGMLLKFRLTNDEWQLNNTVDTQEAFLFQIFGFIFLLLLIFCFFILLDISFLLLFRLGNFLNSQLQGKSDLLSFSVQVFKDIHHLRAIHFLSLLIDHINLSFLGGIVDVFNHLD